MPFNRFSGTLAVATDVQMLFNPDPDVILGETLLFARVFDPVGIIITTFDEMPDQGQT
jgi:hypothetical protein